MLFKPFYHFIDDKGKNQRKIIKKLGGNLLYYKLFNW